MARYHIKEDGNPGVCKAAKDKCPKGGAHFDNETDAREAVEKLFGDSFVKAPEPLAVYTKTAIKSQFSHVWDAKSGRRVRRLNYAFALGADHVSEVYALLTDSRLDVKSQNLRVREALDAKMSSLKVSRNGGNDEEKIGAAVAFEYLSATLEKHYSIPDPRSEGQREADRDFVNHYTSAYDAIPARSDTEALARRDETSEEELRLLTSYEGRSPESLTEEEVEELYSLNPQAREKESRWIDGTVHMDSLEFYREAKRRGELSATVPDNMQEFLVNHMRKSKIETDELQAREEVLNVAPRSNEGMRYRSYSNATSLAEVARDILDIREDNALLRSRVLSS